MIDIEPRHYYSALSTSRVDSKNNIIRDVSLISIGEARGHVDEEGRQVYVDNITLQQVFNSCKSFGSIKVKADHGGGVFTTIGYVDNFKLDGGKVTGNFHIYDTTDEKEKIFEIASKNPTHLGMSLEFTGLDEEQKDKCLARCDEVTTVALVSDPAANKSLFEKSIANIKKTDTTKSMAKKNLETAEQEKEITEQSSEMDASSTFKKMEEILSAFEGRMKAMEDAVSSIATKDAESEAPKAVDPNAEPETQDPEKTFEEGEESDADKKADEARIAKVAEMAATKAIKAYAANIGVTLPKAGAGGVAKGQKTFAEMLDTETKRFDGDKNKAMLHLLSEVKTNPLVKEAYSKYRPAQSSAT